MYWEGDLLFREGSASIFIPSPLQDFKKLKCKTHIGSGIRPLLVSEVPWPYEVQEERNEISRSINRISGLCIESAER